MKPLKVLFVYKYLTLGGVETVLRARLDSLDRHGIEAHAWFFHDLGGRSVFAGREDRICIGAVEECLAAAGDGFDLLVSIDTEEVFPLLKTEAGAGAPRLVVECHSPYLENIEYLRGLAAYHPAAVFVPSDYQRRIVRERLGEGVPVQVVPNPLRAAFVDEPAPFPAPIPRPAVAWIGRMDDLKNWTGFVDLAGRLVQRDPGKDIEFWIAGKPVAAEGGEDLRKRGTEAGILGRLKWFRGLPHARVPAFLDAVRDSGGVVVSTSKGESFGMTVAEAMARGCAVVTPARAPFNEFVTDGETGLLIPLTGPNCIETAAEAIAALLADGERCAEMGRRARAAVLERFAPAPALAALARELRTAALIR
ncbi:MAG TPA: glycosyltransferase family 4 protein [Thermoanaerobaculia bacterium]|nr:glycosyltransferase family 4 protein [Thermoanaerobaculia bacterium]